MRWRRHECKGGCWDEARGRPWRGTAYEIWQGDLEVLEMAKVGVDALWKTLPGRSSAGDERR